jgi:hypothetical protein
MVRLTDPAASPVTMATQFASASDTLRVRLLSMPQARQAPSTASAGSKLPNRASADQLSTRAPATIASMPSAMRRSKFSLKANQASSAVKTPSALSSSEAPEAGMPESPNISSTGPPIPPVSTAPISQGHSRAASRDDCAPLSARNSASPRPEPR